MLIGDVGNCIIDECINQIMTENINFADELFEAWIRFLMSDWGNISEEEKQTNDNIVKHKENKEIQARYKTSRGNIYIKTASDRKYTKIFIECKT